MHTDIFGFYFRFKILSGNKLILECFEIKIELWCSNRIRVDGWKLVVYNNHF